MDLFSGFKSFWGEDMPEKRSLEIDPNKNETQSDEGLETDPQPLFLHVRILQAKQGRYESKLQELKRTLVRYEKELEEAEASNNDQLIELSTLGVEALNKGIEHTELELNKIKSELSEMPKELLSGPGESN